MSSEEHQTRAAVGGPRTGRRPTVDDVARLAGVSRQTVSRVVNGNCPVADRTRERVDAAMATLGYTPDPIAQRLGRYRRAGGPVATDQLGPECLAAIATLRSAGLVVHLHAGGDVELLTPPAR